MNNTLETMIGAALLFGTSPIEKAKIHSEEYLKELELTDDWAKQYSNRSREEQLYRLLQTQKGQDYIRQELYDAVVLYVEGRQFEFGDPLTDTEKTNQKKWALTWMLAKEGSVPSWQQNTMLRFYTIMDTMYAEGQEALLNEAGCDTEILRHAIYMSHVAGWDRHDQGLYDRIDSARKTREADIITQMLGASVGALDEKAKWFEDRINDDVESELKSIIIDEKSTFDPLCKRYDNIWKKFKMMRYHPGTWREDAKAFYQKWIVLFEMAKDGVVPSWQVDWSPEYKSDYLCFLEQIRILKQFGHDPWPLLQQLPDTAPTKHRTLEDVLFEK